MEPASPAPLTSGVTSAVFDWADRLALGGSPSWLVALFLLVVGLAIAFLVGSTVERVSARFAVGGARGRFLGGLVRWLVTALAVLTALERLGVETSSLLAVLASAGLAIGLALQGSLAHFASGVLLLIFRPFDLGDVISVAGHAGQVIDIGVVSVTLETPDKQRVVIPNSVVTGGVLVNLTRSPLRRFEVQVHLGYGVDVSAAEAVLIAAARSLPMVAAGEPVEVVIVNLGLIGPELAVRAWTQATDVATAAPALRRQIISGLQAAQIRFPDAGAVLQPARV